MKRPNNDLQALTTQWQTWGIDDQPVVDERTQTMRPSVSSESAVATLPRLPSLLSPPNTDTIPEVELGRRLGMGGMGEVRLANQVPVGREVAVKSLRKDASEVSGRPSIEATMVLLREGWTTGMLEHPNIVPIYTLGRDDQGSPLIVMKRIEGVSWAELLRDPSKAPRNFDSDDPLDWHIEILNQVCNAVHFAHSKGIIHRDIKPENVMIGAFGEVYLLDWGIAVSFGEETDARLPHASEVSGPAGTPHYMAPEMAAGEVGTLGAATDVYLLGATLYEILTGEPPHRGESLYAIMIQAYRGEPADFPDDVPDGLAQICRRAMAREPEDRFASAEAFRVALADYSRHRESIRLTEEAEARLSDLVALSNEDDDETTQASLYKLFGECRFGFEQALETDEGNARARDGLQRVLEVMAEREIDRGGYAAAALLLADLPHPRADLEERLEALRDRLDDREREFEELKREQFEHNVEVSRRTRSLVTLALGLVWGTLSVYRWVEPSKAHDSGDYSLYFVELGVVASLLALSFWLGRNRLLKNIVNRRILICFGLGFLGSWLLRLNGATAGLPAHIIGMHETLIFGVCAGVMAVTLDRRIWWAAVPYVAGSFLGLLVPDYTQLIWGLTNYTSLGLLAWAWWPRTSRTATS
ncbi:hypothetical protein FIV42_05740 [Persicimonas caeni]|uniref:Protein kinase domain-containing protein n=1 Tax=Persicimonas caeni TaxID=2292766 RepID=A0A4Y6PQ65_PERCE|nr:serine/threonine-protein kinase [Persicimonas caeni]QDG50249.1 hypothetical protein FIV42_05740 [Persicimonas caeni]QED31470.1 protein kinase [Persicimonas caeni]